MYILHDVVSKSYLQNRKILPGFYIIIYQLLNTTSRDIISVRALLVHGMQEGAEKWVSRIWAFIKDIYTWARGAFYLQTHLLLKKDHGTCSRAIVVIVAHTPLDDDILLLPHKSVIPVESSYKTEVCREHVEAGHRGREHAGAAVVGVTDVNYGMGEDDDLVRSGLFIRRRVGIEGYHGLL